MRNELGKAKAFLRLMRPAEWTKSFGNMVIAAVLAAFTFNVVIPWIEFFLGVLGVVFLWSGLYALNDVMDWREDSKHRVKKRRPIPSGRISPAAALIFSLLLLFFSLGMAVFLGNVLFFICLMAMFVNQLMYSTKPFSLKKRSPWDLVSGSLVNPIFRFYAGWVLVVPAFNAPILPLLFVVGLQFGGYGLYRLISADHDKKLGYKSTVARFSEKKLRVIFYLAIAIGGLSFFAMALSEQFFPLLTEYGSLPAKYLWLAVGSLLLVPLYWRPMKKPEKANMEKIYRILYFHYLLFIGGFLFLYLV